MSLISKVEVLCPNGHRVTVNVKPNTKLLQVAEECCLKQHLGAATGFGLKMRHNQKPVDMSLSVQLAGLTNNAKLDLYQRTNQKMDAKARIALQMDGIGRLQQEFDSSKTLWEVLESFQSSGGHLNIFQLMSDGQQPVVNYMKEEILSEYALRSTTLRTLGILDGGHLLRLSFRIISPEALEDIRNKIDKETARLSRLAARAASGEMSPQIASTGDRPSLRTAPAEPVPCTAGNNRPESGCKDSLSEDKMDTLVADELQTNQENAGNPNIQAWPMDTLSEPPVANDNRAYQQFPFMEFKFPEETRGLDLYHNQLSEVRREDFQPCERESVLYSLNDVEGIEYEAEEDGFFEHTVEDIKMLKDCLEHEAKSFSNEQDLLTQSMRLGRQSPQPANYQYSRFILRFQFPGRFVLQGVFRPLETVFALYKYVKESLEDKNLDFELFMSPPKVILDNKMKTLTEAGLSPMTVIYFKSGDRNDGFLAREVLNCISSPAEAKQVRVKYMPADSSRPRVTRQQQDPSSRQPSTSSLSAQVPSSSSHNRAQNATNASNKIPKWFKPGK